MNKQEIEKYLEQLIVDKTKDFIMAELNYRVATSLAMAGRDKESLANQTKIKHIKDITENYLRQTKQLLEEVRDERFKV